LARSRPEFDTLTGQGIAGQGIHHLERENCPYRPVSGGLQGQYGTDISAREKRHLSLCRFLTEPETGCQRRFIIDVGRHIDLQNPEDFLA